MVAFRVSFNETFDATSTVVLFKGDAFSSAETVEIAPTIMNRTHAEL